MARRDGEPIYRRITVRMHGDEKVRRLSPETPSGRGLWWHLLAGEQTGIIPGLFKIGEQAFAEQLGWPLEIDASKGIEKGFRECFAEVEREGMAKADWKARVVFVPNAVTHNFPQSPNVILHWRDAWDLLPECALKVEAWQHVRSIFKGEGESWLKAFEKACPKPFTKASPNQGTGNREQGSGRKASSALPPTADGSGPTKGDADKVFDEWCRVMVKNGNALFTAERERKVKARLREGYTIERLFKAIQGCKNSPYHQGKNETGTLYDDIELICRDGKHVEKFEEFADRPPPNGAGKPGASITISDQSKKESEIPGRKIL